MNTEEPTIKDQLASWVGVGESEPTEPAPPLDLGPGERVAWSGTVTARWPLLIGLALAAGGIIELVVAGTIIGTILVIAGLSVLAFCRVRVAADSRGVRVSMGFPFPRKTVPISAINHAAAIDLHPMEWGGWGYRVARPAKGFSRTAVVLRKGEALHLTLRSGREFAVTVDGADEAAAVVNAYVTP